MRVLFIEDNITLANATSQSLMRSGFAVDVMNNIDDGWHAWQCNEYDAIILDIMLDGKDGLELLAQARRNALHTPVILLTALSTIDARVRGLNRGADDYLVKPFAIEELIARLRALGRRPETLLDTKLVLGRATYDTTKQTLSVDGTICPLSRAESIILERFFRRPEIIINKTQLGEALHSIESEFSDNSVHIIVHRIRKKLNDLNAGIAIHTVRGLGYFAATEQEVI